MSAARSPYNNIKAAFVALYGPGKMRYMLAAYLANGNHLPYMRVAPTVPTLPPRIYWRHPADVDQELAQEAQRLTAAEKQALKEMWFKARELYIETLKCVNQ
jgi:hypothetical protein